MSYSVQIKYINFGKADVSKVRVCVFEARVFAQPLLKHHPTEAMPHLLALPAEILDVIISCLFDLTDRNNIRARNRALSILCRVNKCLRFRALPKLYENIKILSARMEDAFDWCITEYSTSDDIGKLVKSLRWISATADSEEHQWDDWQVESPGRKLRNVLKKLNGLEELNMSQMPDHCYWNDIAGAAST